MDFAVIQRSKWLPSEAASFSWSQRHAGLICTKILRIKCQLRCDKLLSAIIQNKETELYLL